MNNFQEKMLTLFGGNVISCDSAHGTNSNNFLLHTILVLDEKWEGIGVAFMLSNQNDKVVLEVFLNVIKKKVGLLSLCLH